MDEGENYVISALGAILEQAGAAGAGKVSLYEDLAKKLSELAQQEPPWGWRYVQGVAAGKVRPGDKFGRAVMALGAMLDGASPLMARAERLQVLVLPGRVAPGSVVLGESRRCGGCMVLFVPVVPWQRFCSPDCRKKKKLGGV